VPDTVAVIVSVEVADGLAGLIVTDNGLNEKLSPLPTELDADNVTVPEKPF
jgi:hypothetical protein